MPLDDFRRQFHSEIAKKISFLSGPVRMSISGKVPAAGSLTVVVDSNPSTGYHWVADSSSGAEVLFKKTTFNRRSFRRGTVQSQQLIFTSNQVNGDRELKAISCNLHLALRIQGKVQPMLIQGEKSLPELLSILNKTKNSSIPLSRD
jgi:hypothetical protein